VTLLQSLVTASQALQAAFVAARDAGAEDAASSIRLAQLDINMAPLAAVPDAQREGRFQ